MPVSRVMRAITMVLVVLVCCGLVRADLAAVDIDQVVTTLQNNFAKIVAEELGASRLSAEYGKAQYTYDMLNFTSLVNSIDQGGLDLINQLFANITAANSTFNKSICCNDSIPLANCTGCNTTAAFLDYVKTLFTAALGSHDINFSLGLDDGTLISPSTNLTGWSQDARLQPWFVNVTASRPREVVILATLTTSSANAIKGAVQAVITSLNPQDKVAVGFSLLAGTVTQAPSLQGLTYACDLNKASLLSFISGISPPMFPVPVDISAAIPTALSLFTSNPTTDKLLLLFVDTTYPNMLANLTSAPVLVSIYYVNNLLQLINTNPNIYLGNLGIKSPADYYSALITPATSVTEAVFTRENSSSGLDTLGVSQRVSLLGLSGVFHANIPLVHVLGTIPSALVKRPSSTFFVADARSRALLFHPSLPPSTSNFSLEVVETGLSPALNLSSTGPQSVNRTFLLPLNSTDRGYVIQTATSTANCWPMSLLGRSLAVCVVVAASDVTLATLVPSSVSFADAYSTASRLPANSNVAQSIQMAYQCNYFCTLSTKSNTSIQLTMTPSDQLASINTLDSFNSFLKGGVTPLLPLAAEIAIATSASYGWIGQSTSVRSHLTTPSGAYLTYPALQLTSSFQPAYTLWYTTAVAHPGLISLSPATFNVLNGAAYTISSALLASPPSVGQVRAVLASDRSMGSLRAMLSMASNGACDASGILCFIIDDVGRLVYSSDILTYLSASTAGPFFISNYGSGNMFQEILKVLISTPGFPVKQACTDYLSPSVKFRVFYSFPLYNSSTLVGSGMCTQFKLKMIPGTNAFFGVATKTCTPSMSCFCPDQCINCAALQVTACECPCSCLKDCLNPLSLMACPSGVSGVANYVGQSYAATSLPSCFSPACNSISNLSTCAGTVGCQWCYAQQKCLLSTDCCNTKDTSTCCQGLPACVCSNAPVTTPAPYQSSDNTAIIAGVVGGVVGAAILAVLVVFFVWYQYVRKPEPDDGVRDNVFDFSKRTDARNPVTMDVVTSPEADVKEDQRAEKKEKDILPEKAESTI